MLANLLGGLLRLQVYMRDTIVTIKVMPRPLCPAPLVHPISIASSSYSACVCSGADNMRGAKP